MRRSPYTITVTKQEVVLFKNSWRRSGLADKSYWFEFDGNGNLVDTSVTEAEDRSAASALAEDAKAYLRYCLVREGKTPKF